MKAEKKTDTTQSVLTVEDKEMFEICMATNKKLDSPEFQKEKKKRIREIRKDVKALEKQFGKLDSKTKQEVIKDESARKIAESELAQT